jgi:hypothetical protein
VTSNQEFRTARRTLHVEAEMIAELMRAHLFRGGRLFGLLRSGAEGARTPDLRHAMAALFQLSYSPEPVLIREV